MLFSVCLRIKSMSYGECTLKMPLWLFLLFKKFLFLTSFFNQSFRWKKKLIEIHQTGCWIITDPGCQVSSLRVSPLSCKTDSLLPLPTSAPEQGSLKLCLQWVGGAFRRKAQEATWVLDLALSGGTQTSKLSALKFFPKCCYRMQIEFIVTSLKTILRFKQTFRDYWIKTFRIEKDGSGQAGKLHSLKQWLGLGRVWQK